MSNLINEPTLTLNRNWLAITFRPVKVAITDVMRDMASILDPHTYELLTLEEWMGRDYEDAHYIQTASRPIMVPEVIVLKQYGERPPRRISFGKGNLARRDNYECQYCGEDIGVRRATIDHVFPKSRGGENSWENCVAACSACNNRKADRTPNEAGMRLRKAPAKPTWSPSLPLPQCLRKSWEPFLKTA